jgi:hypothetical protein
MLQQDAQVGMVHEQSGRAERAPESLAIGTLDPIVPRVAQMRRQQRRTLAH